MKIIFLDIYGVLITNRTIFSNEIFNKPFLYMWDEIGIGIIKKICREFEAKIVISSRFRITENKILSENIKKYGFMKYLHKNFYTPDCGNDKGEEINKWLEKHQDVTKYAILEDEIDFFNKEQLNFVVKTTLENGILFENFLELRKIFLKNN